MVGQAPGGSNIATHPVLSLGVANQAGRELVLFNSKSLAERAKLYVAKGADMRPLLLTFGGKGCKAVVWNGDNGANPEEGLHFIPLDLKPDERAALQKVYGKLPPPSATESVAAKAKTSTKPAENAKPDPADPDPKKSAAKSGSKTVASTGTTKPMPAKSDSSAGAATRPATGAASAGFNDAKGINSDRTPGSPYTLGEWNRPGGRGEPDWAAPWEPSDHATFQKEVVQEGDGALHLRGTVNYSRRLLRPQTGIFQVEHYVQIPAGGNLTVYVWKERENGAGNSGPMWTIKNGKFHVLAGDEAGGGEMTSTGFDCLLDTWYKITLVVDVPKRRWEFFVNDKKFEGKPLGFRTRQQFLQEINFLVESQPGAFIDAVRIGPVAPAAKAK